MSVAELSEQPEQDVSSKQIDVKPKAATSRSSSGILFPILILSLVIGLAAAGFYFLTQLRNKQEGLGGEVKGQLTQQINDYQKQLTAIQQNISTLQAELNGKDEHFNKILAEFSDLHGQKMEATRKELSDKVLQVQRQLGKTRGDWLIADAEYLLSVANERLHLVGDVNTTRAALEAADQRLRESGDTGTIKIREEIAKEISLLQGIAPPDMVGLYSRLQALEVDVAKLALALPYAGKPLTPPEESNNDSAVSEDSNDLINSAIHGLEGIVTIKRSEKPIKEILTQEQADFIREQLKIKLELVKIALVHQDDSLFQASLKDLSGWGMQHFTNNEALGHFTSELDKLQLVKLRTQFPDISQSLKMLRDVTKLRIETDKALGLAEEPKLVNNNDPKITGKEKDVQPTQPEKVVSPAVSPEPITPEKAE